MIQSNITISKDKSLLDIDVIRSFLNNQSYWAKDRSEEIIVKSIANSICYGMYEEGAQIGFARVVSDRAVFAWIMDVFILPDCRQRGLGKQLMKVIMEDEVLVEVKRWGLATDDAHGLYEKFGFALPEKPEILMFKVPK